MNPFAYWTQIWLKSGQAMLEVLQDSAARARPPKVAVIPTADAPKPAARKKAPKPRKPRVKARAKRKRKARRQA